MNGVPQAGKTSIVKIIQDTFEGVWMNLGVDVFVRGVTPNKYQPGIGLRPGPGPKFGGDAPELEPLVPTFYTAMYESIAVHSRLGLNVVTDVCHHGAIHPEILPSCARQLTGLPVLFVGVRCSIEEIMKRRSKTEDKGWYVIGTVDEPVPPPVILWQEEVHKPGIYDLEVDTSQLNPQDCAKKIKQRLVGGPPGTVFQHLAEQA